MPWKHRDTQAVSLSTPAFWLKNDPPNKVSTVSKKVLPSGCASGPHHGVCRFHVGPGLPPALTVHLAAEAVEYQRVLLARKAAVLPILPTSQVGSTAGDLSLSAQPNPDTVDSDAGASSATSTTTVLVPSPEADLDVLWRLPDTDWENFQRVCLRSAQQRLVLPCLAV